MRNVKPKNYCITFTNDSAIVGPFKSISEAEAHVVKHFNANHFRWRITPMKTPHE